MENKYYLPKIEEFHIGFEYEVRQQKMQYGKCVYGNEWETIECEGNMFLQYIDISSGNIRVKYLDSSDIESLGFKVEKDDEYAGEYYFSKENSIIGKFLTEDKKYNIEMFSTYFIVKNKSEFKKLLMQLDLINE